MSLPESNDAPTPQRRGPSKPVTGLAVERVLERSLSIMSLVFGAQAVPIAMAQSPSLRPSWALLMLVLVFGSFLVLVVAGFVGRFVPYVASITCVVFVVALATWPFAFPDLTQVQPSGPWLWYVCNMVLAAAVFAFSTWVATAYLFIIPGLFFYVRQTPAGGGVAPGQAALDASYAIVLGAAVLILVSLLRRAAQSVDIAQSAAVSRYSEAVRQHATELERVQVDSIVHDGVLTAFISAGKADTPRARSLAAAMAKTSMDRLGEAMAGHGAADLPVPLIDVHERIREAMAQLDTEAEISDARLVPAMLLPADIAEALGDATIQAVVNSCQHAGDGASRYIQVRAVGGVAEIVVADDGAGYDTSVKSERLGVRVSILERVNGIGGVAAITSAPGHGTVVTLRWASESEPADRAMAVRV
ncbi:signal transduction histidine kinase [Frondihabitans sp. PhB188]|uniref:ATP-binding protein n=1 Tax=Frondihabitans sp. PhB188 TaxID=2485200 RepID=UPI000F462CA3|nr:ATP-binding protein [Frondihabitans sp. PhB188]ROQ37369.1 signal transduction histidine kinase [Frondihabitans sp. PhB188]